MKLIAPLSLAWFAVTALVVGLQMVPQIGVFLMILAAPFWSVFTVNLGFLCIVAEALAFRWVSRWWLVLPILWFGGYAIWAAVDNLSFDKAETHVSEAEAGPAIPFDPARSDLFISGSDADRTAAELVHDYDLPVVYSVSPRPGPRAATGEERLIAHRIARLEACETLDADRAGLARQDIRRENRFVRGAPNAYCQYTVPGTPRRPVVTAPLDPETASLRYQPEREPLPLFPMPVMGCGLNSNTPKWECGVAFARMPSGNGRGRREPNDGPAERLASRLALAPRQGVPASAEASAEITAAINAVVRAAERDLERILADPTVKLDGPAPLSALQDRPEIIGRHADRIVGTLERRWADPAAASSINRLMDLLSYMSDADLQRFAPRLRALYAHPSPAATSVRFSSRLRERLDLRPAAR